VQSRGNLGELSGGLAERSYAGFLEAAVQHKVDLYHYGTDEIKEEIGGLLPEGIDLQAIKRELDSP
jgi:hypothetical protein